LDIYTVDLIVINDACSMYLVYMPGELKAPQDLPRDTMPNWVALSCPSI
jgi:hypothetical protein